MEVARDNLWLLGAGTHIRNVKHIFKVGGTRRSQDQRFGSIPHERPINLRKPTAASEISKCMISDTLHQTERRAMRCIHSLIRREGKRDRRMWLIDGLTFTISIL